MPELKTVLPNAGFVIAGCVDPREPLREEGPFGEQTGLDATKQLASEGCKRPWPPLIKMDEAVKAKAGKLFDGGY